MYAACCPLLREGGVRGGSEIIVISQTRFIATTPSYGHPSSPEDGTTLGDSYSSGQRILNEQAVSNC
jgi:hypothetical protein